MFEGKRVLDCYGQWSKAIYSLLSLGCFWSYQIVKLTFGSTVVWRFKDVPDTHSCAVEGLRLETLTRMNKSFKAHDIQGRLPSRYILPGEFAWKGPMGATAIRNREMRSRWEANLIPWTHTESDPDARIWFEERLSKAWAARGFSGSW